MPNLRAAAVLLFSVASAAVSAQVLYRSVGPDGKVSYTDRPPTEGRIEKTLRAEDLPNTAIPPKTQAELDQLALWAKQRQVTARQVADAAKPQAAGPVLYSASWCGYCRLARAYLQQKNIGYREIDIDQPDGKLAFAQAGGGGGIPLLVAGEQKLRGFRADAYDRFFAARR